MICRAAKTLKQVSKKEYISDTNGEAFFDLETRLRFAQEADRPPNIKVPESLSSH